MRSVVKNPNITSKIFNSKYKTYSLKSDISKPNSISRKVYKPLRINTSFDLKMTFESPNKDSLTTNKLSSWKEKSGKAKNSNYLAEISSMRKESKI